MTFAVNRPSRDASSRFIPAVGGSVECASGSTEIIVRGELRAGLEVCFEGHDFLRVLVIPNSTAHRLSTVIFDPTMPASI